MTWTCILRALNTLGRSGFIAILTASLLLGAAAARAEENISRVDERAGGEEEPSQRDELMDVSCRDEEDRPDSWLDRTHSYLNQRLCEPAAWFDGFFGDDRALEETPVGTFFRLRNEVRWDQSEDLRARVRLSANISLPGASEKLRLLLTRDEDVHGEFDNRAPVEEGQQDTRLGLRYNLSDQKRSRLDLDATVRANFTTLNPIVRARYRHVEPLSRDTFMRFTQIGFWEGEDGYGATSRADWEWFRNFDTQDRFTLEGTWSEATDGIEWRTGVTRFHQLDHVSALRGELGAVGWTEPRLETNEYFANLRYRRTFLRPWLFYELQPERAWVQDRNDSSRQGDWRFIVTLEIQFENAPARAEREERESRRLWNRLEQSGALDPDPADGAVLEQ